MSPTTVFISNLSEDVWPFISSMSDPQVRQAEIDENANLCDRDLFSLAHDDNFLFITPRAVSPTFLEYYRHITRNRNITTLATRSHTGSICQDILKDTAIMSAIATAANSIRRLTLISYCSSPQFLTLVKQLQNQGLTIYTPEAPEEEDAWSVNFYGSKSGIRQLSQQSSATEPDLKMPDGLIVSGVTDAAQIAAWTYFEQNSVVIKTNKGHSGAGVLIFRPGDLPADYHSCTQIILDTLKKDAYWNLFPIIIEDYVTPATTIAGGFPNVEFKILKSGKVEYLYYGGMASMSAKNMPPPVTAAILTSTLSLPKTDSSMSPNPTSAAPAPLTSTTPPWIYSAKILCTQPTLFPTITTNFPTPSPLISSLLP